MTYFLEVPPPEKPSTHWFGNVELQIGDILVWFDELTKESTDEWGMLSGNVNLDVWERIEPRLKQNEKTTLRIGSERIPIEYQYGTAKSISYESNSEQPIVEMVIVLESK